MRRSGWFPEVRGALALIVISTIVWMLCPPVQARPVQGTYTGLIYSLPPGPSPVPVATNGAGQGKFWLSNFAAATGDPTACAAHPGDTIKCDALNWLLPPWFPQHAYIWGATVGQQQPIDGHDGQFAIGIDRGGLSYRNAKPPYHQAGGDTRWRQLASLWTGIKKQDYFPVSGPPVEFNQARGDRLWIEDDTLCYISSTPGVVPAVCSPRTIWFTIWYEYDDTDVSPILTGWNTIFGPVTMEASNPAWVNYTIRVSVDADLLDGIATGTKTRVTLAADHISSAYICPRALYTDFQCAGSQQQLTFGGIAGATATGGIITSDVMNFGVDPTNGIVVTVHTVDGNIQTHSVMPSVQYAYRLGDDASNPVPSPGYTFGTPSVSVLAKIEQFY